MHASAHIPYPKHPVISPPYHGCLAQHDEFWPDAAPAYDSVEDAVTSEPVVVTSQSVVMRQDIFPGSFNPSELMVAVNASSSLGWRSISFLSIQECNAEAVAQDIALLNAKATADDIITG